jgi:hypothetical protein
MVRNFHLTGHNLIELLIQKLYISTRLVLKYKFSFHKSICHLLYSQIYLIEQQYQLLASNFKVVFILETLTFYAIKLFIFSWFLHFKFFKQFWLNLFTFLHKEENLNFKLNKLILHLKFILTVFALVIINLYVLRIRLKVQLL